MNRIEVDPFKGVVAQQRFTFGGESAVPVSRHRAAWISDCHLGTRGANSGVLLEFLREHDFDVLYVVGDLIDGWALRRAFYWPQEHNDVIQKI